MSKDLAQVRICVQETLPGEQQEIHALQNSDMSAQHFQRLSAAFWAKKMWPKGAKVTIGFLGSGNQVPKTPLSALKKKGADMDPLQAVATEVIDSGKYKDPVQDMIRKIVKERIQPLINLRLEFIDNGAAANVRISFDSNTGAWSLVGTDCLRSRPGEATMNLGWFDVPTTIHEFGHMLGMIHEHQNPRGQKIQWNDAAVYAWAKRDQGWNKQQTDTNILDKYDVATLNGSSFDPQSIMLYFFGPELTTNNVGTKQNLRYSGMDVEWIHQMYPTEHGETPASFYKNVYHEDIKRSIEKSKREAAAFGSGNYGGGSGIFGSDGVFSGNVNWKTIGVVLAVIIGIILLVAVVVWFFKRNGGPRRYRYGRY